jgi:hypothetical protein
LIALLIGALAAYYIINHRGVMALIALGIALNCLPVVICGVNALRRKDDHGGHIGSYWNKKARERHRQENPHMLRDTLVLVVLTLLPFVSLVTVLFEVSKHSKND